MAAIAQCQHSTPQRLLYEGLKFKAIEFKNISICQEWSLMPGIPVHGKRRLKEHEGVQGSPQLHTELETSTPLTPNSNTLC